MRSRLLLAACAFTAVFGAASLLAQRPASSAPATRCEPVGMRALCEDVSAARRGRRPRSKKQAAPAAQPNKPAVVERTPYTEQDREAAVIPDLPGVRFFADSFGAFSDALPRQRGPWLILSSGGSSGAYGAGVLVGLSQAGKRPDYAMVTGVSIGAVMAPYAFLGQKYDDKLRDSFLTLTSADVFEDAVRADSLVDTWPLKDQLAKRVTPELLADIAAEHNKGRRLFVVTADFDSERLVVWNLGAIAAHGSDANRTEAALKLFRQVLLAASAIPGIFPPVFIDAEANGKKFQEMHADGGVFGPFFAAPPLWLIDPGEKLPVTRFDVILHSKLVPEFNVTGAEKIFILGRTISAAVKAGAKAELALLAAAAKHNGTELNVAYVDNTFHEAAQTAFDQKQMTKLFNLGLEQAKNGTAFRTQSPAPAGQTMNKP